MVLEMNSMGENNLVFRLDGCYYKKPAKLGISCGQVLKLRRIELKFALLRRERNPCGVKSSCFIFFIVVDCRLVVDKILYVTVYSLAKVAIFTTNVDTENKYLINFRLIGGLWSNEPPLLPKPC